MNILDIITKDEIKKIRAKKKEKRKEKKEKIKNNQCKKYKVIFTKPTSNRVYKKIISAFSILDLYKELELIKCLNELEDEHFEEIQELA